MPTTAQTTQPIDRSDAPSLVPGASSIIDRNITALTLRAPRLAKQIAETTPTQEIEFIETGEGDALSAVYRDSALASRRRPITEADRLASTVDLADVGAVVVLGFGVGHHIAALTRSAKGAALIVVFEPDVALLRTVFERVDCSGMLASGNVAICTEAGDLGALTEAIHGSETLIAMGVRFIEHPPSTARLGESASTFSQTVANVVATVRSQIITTMVQSEMSLRNSLMNAKHYANGLGIADLEGAAAGSPAIVIAAGPSLRRNIHMLRDPMVRERCVLIAVQTVLKPLLAMGIKPHFVTALDYHEISARFYEGLTAEDLEGVTLVTEAKANPAILDSYPGVIRCVGDELLDRMLGSANTKEHGTIKPGATVAHLSCYLARHLGCDPIIMTGQDLGFTDGQYYSDGASIHRVWACEINPFRTLEMFEWERIVRGRSILRQATDHLGRTIYTDEQMASYLTQFEHDFLNDTANGLTIIDATEGGVRKAHTSPMPLADAIDTHVRKAPTLDAKITLMPDRHNPAVKQKRLQDRLTALRQETVRLAGTTSRTGELLDEIKACIDDTAKANPMIERVQKLSAEAQAIQPAFEVVGRINQTGAFNRIRTDRALRLEDDLDPRLEQKRRIERDRINLRWFTDAADSFVEMLETTIYAHEQGEVRTRIPSADPVAVLEGKAQNKARCVAFIDASIGSQALLDVTLARLEHCKEVDGVEIITGAKPDITNRLRAIRAARLFSPAAWRGGIAGLTCFDELFDPRRLAQTMAAHNADAALLVGADWALVDPALCDEIIRRHREHPTEHRLTFSQAPPGIAGAVVARSLVEEIRDAPPTAGAFATLGGLLGYLPMRPTADRIAKSVCVSIPASLRDTLGRFIADTPCRERYIRELINNNPDWISTPADQLIGSLIATDGFHTDAFPAHTICSATNADALIDWCKTIQVDRSDAALTLQHPPLDSIGDIIDAARNAGFASIHVRSMLDGPAEHTESLRSAKPDIISIDMLATTSEVYRELTGADRFDRVIENTERLIDTRENSGGIPSPWIVPRITRRDAVYEQLESFYDYWICRTGAAVIDPLPAPIEGERITPLTTPTLASAYEAMTTQRIDLDRESKS